MKDAEKQRNREMTDAGSIKQLVERVNTAAAAARLIGVSPTTISHYLTTGTAPLTAVLAARYHLSMLDKKTNGWAFAALIVPADKRAAFDAICQGLGLEVKYFVR